MSQLRTEKNALQYVKEGVRLLMLIRAHIGEIQAKIDVLRKDGGDQAQKLRNHVQLLKEDKHIKKKKKDALTAESNVALSAAQTVESKNQAEVAGLVAEAESYLKGHYEKDYFDSINKNCKKDRENAKQRCQAWVTELGKEHEQEAQRLRKENVPDLQQGLKDENYVYRNRLFDTRVTHEQKLQAIKDRRHEAFVEQYHMINLFRIFRFVFTQEQAQRVESYKYTFNQWQFLLEDSLYIVIVAAFIAPSIAIPIARNTQLFTYNNILNILQRASPHTLLTLGVASLIFLTGTDFSIGRMAGMGMVVAATITHRGVSTGAVFGKIFGFTPLFYAGRTIFALLVCIVLTIYFILVVGFFTARFKMHPFISTMLNMLVVLDLMTYTTKGMSFGTIKPGIALMIVPKVNDFPPIALWAVAAIVIVRFIQNKTRFGKNPYIVGGNPEAVSVSGISVLAVTMDVFMVTGVLYGFGAWLERVHMVGFGSAAYDQDQGMDAIVAYVVGGVLLTGGIDKISGIMVGVLIFTALTYSSTILGIDMNLQFVLEGIIVLTAVTLDCSKYIQKK